MGYERLKRNEEKHRLNAKLAKEKNWNDLFLENIGFFVGRAKHLCPPTLSVEYVLQEFFLEFLRRADRWKPQLGSFTNYFSVCCLRWIVQIAKRHDRPERALCLHASCEAIAPTPDFDTLDIQDLRRLMTRELDDEQRAILYWRFFDGRTLKWCGEQLDVSKESVRLRERAAVEKLRRAFTR